MRCTVESFDVRKIIRAAESELRSTGPIAERVARAMRWLDFLDPCDVTDDDARDMLARVREPDIAPEERERRIVALFTCAHTPAIAPSAFDSAAWGNFSWS